MIQVLYNQVYEGSGRLAFNLSFDVTPAQLRDVTFNGIVWREYKITKSCNMFIEGQSPNNCAVWMCGGGGAGAQPTSNLRGAGGGGGGFTQLYSGRLASGALVIGGGGYPRGTKGDDGGATSLTMPVLGLTIEALGGVGGYEYRGGAGGSGGGGGGSNFSVIGTGAGISTTPFFDDVNHYPLCGGGGGGGYWTDSTTVKYGGGDAGHNGEDGLLGQQFPGSQSTVRGGIGGGTKIGHKSGGNGSPAGSAQGTNNYQGGAGEDFGGGGGGGGGAHLTNTTIIARYVGGWGKQGVMFLRVPLRAA